MAEEKKEALEKKKKAPKPNIELPGKSPFTPGTKMRIVTYPDGERNDRLVEQATEFRMGPKEVYQGPFTIELNLHNQEDVEGALNYLRQLKGELPLNTPGEKKVKPKKLDAMLSEKEPLEDLVKQAKVKAAVSQEKLIDFLREFDFRFMASDVILDNAVDHPGQLTIKEKHHDYQWMVRLVKEAKDPANDKWDWRLAFGIKYIGERVDKVQVYLWSEYHKTWTAPWEEPKKINFKKVEKVYTFPEFMDYADRKAWRKENRAKMAAEAKGEEFKPTKNFLKWSPFVKVN